MPRASRQRDTMKPVRRWLWLLGIMVLLMVMLGGATRLTGSGLSITEWRPITGVLPPMSDTAWQAQFERYQAISQFRIVNPDMTLTEFKFIYWWEWAHRFAGRALALLFLIPFGLFLWERRIDRALAWKLVGIFALGALQGLAGWWMVASGLGEGTDVSPYRLAFHLTLAAAILAAIVATATSLDPHPSPPAPRRVRVSAGLVLGLVFVQIFLGALVAKTGAGLTFNTWPLIDGELIPPFEALFLLDPAWRNLVENVLAVQFFHRLGAYALVAAAAWHAFDAARHAPAAHARRASLLFAFVTAQAMLGVLTLVTSAPLPLALAHQAGAFVVAWLAAMQLAELFTQPELGRDRRSGPRRPRSRSTAEPRRVRRRRPSFARP